MIFFECINICEDSDTGSLVILYIYCSGRSFIINFLWMYWYLWRYIGSGWWFILLYFL